MLSLLIQGKKQESQRVDWKQVSDFVTTEQTYSLLRKELYDNFLCILFKSLNPVQPFQGDSLLLTTESLGGSGTLLINITMKTPRGFKSVNPGLVIGNHSFDSLLFHYYKAMYKIFKI